MIKAGHHHPLMPASDAIHMYMCTAASTPRRTYFIVLIAGIIPELLVLSQKVDPENVESNMPLATNVNDVHVTAVCDDTSCGPGAMKDACTDVFFFSSALQLSRTSH